MCCCDEINVFEWLSLDFFCFILIIMIRLSFDAFVVRTVGRSSWVSKTNRKFYSDEYLCLPSNSDFSVLFWADIFILIDSKKKKDDQRKHMRSYDQICLCVRKRAKDMKQNFRMVAKKVENWLCTSRKVRFNAHHMPPQVEFSSWTVISSNIRSFHLFRFGQRTPCVSFTALKLLVHW